MKINNKWIFGAILLFIILLVSNIYSYKLYRETKIKLDSNNDLYNYDTKVINSYESIKELIERQNRKLDDYIIVKPKVITNYIKEKPTYIIQKHTDSLIYITDTIDKKSLEIPTEFLTLYPENPKLLNFTLDKTNLDISLLNIDGQTSTKEYPLDLNNYSYIYNQNGLNVKPIEYKQKYFSWTDLYIYTGYDPLKQNVQSSLEWNFDISKSFRLGLMGRVNLNNINENNTTIRIGYRLLNR